MASKTADAGAAKELVGDLLSGDETGRLKAFMAGRQPNILAVTADETMGFNAIPDAMGQALAARLPTCAGSLRHMVGGCSV